MSELKKQVESIRRAGHGPLSDVRVLLAYIAELEYAPAPMTLTEEQAAALARWANEQDGRGGCSGYGRPFDDAMQVARAVRDGSESR